MKRDPARTVLVNLYNLGVERARRVYREDRLYAEGVCVKCEQRKTTITRVCQACRKQKDRER